MDVDPLEHVEDEEESKGGDRAKGGSLNRMVAVTVAVLATFMGICKVKDDNIVQAMQQAQADKIDSYSWYQARNIREEVATATAAQLTAQLASTPADARAAVQQQIESKARRRRSSRTPPRRPTRPTTVSTCTTTSSTSPTPRSQSQSLCSP